MTTNAIIIFIMYLYMYLLDPLYLLRFIVVSNFIQLESIYSTCISTVFIELYLLNLYVFIYSYLLGWILSSFIQYMYYKIY